MPGLNHFFSVDSSINISSEINGSTTCIASVVSPRFAAWPNWWYREFNPRPAITGFFPTTNQLSGRRVLCGVFA